MSVFVITGHNKIKHLGQGPHSKSKRNNASISLQSTNCPVEDYPTCAERNLTWESWTPRSPASSGLNKIPGCWAQNAMMKPSMIHTLVNSIRFVNGRVKTEITKHLVQSIRFHHEIDII
jgi:hypothetical protein